MRVLSLARDIVASNLTRRGRPFKLTLILNYACNCRCAMCDIWKKSSRDDMSAEEIERFFERQGHWTWVNLSGGEILMKPKAEEIVRTVTTRNPRLYLLDFPTTGFRGDRLLGLARIALESKVKKVAITVSLDGPPAVHDRIRQSPGLFEDAVASLRRLFELGDQRLMPKAGMTLSAENSGLVEETLAVLRERIPGFRREDLHLNLAQTSAHYYGNDDHADLQRGVDRSAELEAISAHRAKTEAKGFVSRLERRFQNDLISYSKKGTSPYVCRALRSSVFIDPFWNVYPCITWNRRLGNLREHDFDLDELMETSQVREAQELIEKKKCPDCWTACEAYQTILGNGWKALRRELAPQKGSDS
ncbi:MAG: radical SAM protein [Planctomycetota bacterium]